MKFRFTTAVAGDRYAFMEGAVIETTELGAQVRDWLQAGLIVPVRDDGVHVAVVSPPERAVTVRRGRRRHRGHDARAALVAG